MHFKQAVRHHDQVGQHIVRAEEASECYQQLGHVRVAALDDFLELMLSLGSPMPGILKGRDLSMALASLRRLEEEVVITLGIEERIQIHQVHRFILDGFPQNLKVIAKVEGIFFASGAI